MITSPTSTHRELVLATLDAGKALFCEKPLAPNFADVRELCDAVAMADTPRPGRLPLPLPPHRQPRSGGSSHRAELGAPMAYTLRDDQYWPTGAVVPGPQLVAFGSGPGRGRRSPRALDPCRRHRVLAVRPGRAGLGQHPGGVRVRRRGRGGGHGRARVGCRRHHPQCLQRRAWTRGASLRGLLRGRRRRGHHRLHRGSHRGQLARAADPMPTPQRPDLDAMREEHFAALGLPRRDFVFYTYPADRHWVRCVQRRRAGVPGLRRRPARARARRRRLSIGDLRSRRLAREPTACGRAA